MDDMKKLSDQDLDAVAGGIGGPAETGWKWVAANVKTGYLALRSSPSYDYRNEIARIVNGTVFQIKPDETRREYVYACFNGLKGWVNSNYITGFAAQGT